MTKEEKIKQIQAHLKKEEIDGWLLYDFHRNNSLAHEFLEIPASAIATRRFFYWIPKEGNPVQVVHAIESHVLEKWPGTKRIFSSWRTLHQELGTLLRGMRRVAMEYSPLNENPYVSYVDGGTVDLVRSFGPEVVSSSSFLVYFTEMLTKDQGESHIRAAKTLEQIVYKTWAWIAEQLKKNTSVSEFQIQKWILGCFEESHLASSEPPIVAINAHSADPHFETSKEGLMLQKGDFLLIDLWAKEKREGAVFGDLTRVCVAAKEPTKKQQEIFALVRKAQKAGIDLIKRRFLEKKQVLGFEVDDAVRAVIREAGFEKYFIHRTGHSIGSDHLHGSGTHLDNLEMHETRPLVPGTCFSVEPGIYLPAEFGVRLESDVYIHLDGRVEVTGGEQEEICCLLRD